MNNIVLIGFMGSGKSSIGYRLSYRLKRALLDTDKQIEKEQNCTISEIFATKGESAFRRMETELLERLKETSKNQIISTGGGTPMKAENRPLLKEIGCVVFLKVKPETVLQRVGNDPSRPLLQGDNPAQIIQNLLQQREPVYEQLADLIIETDGKEFAAIIKEIQEGVEKYEAVSHQWT